MEPFKLNLGGDKGFEWVLAVDSLTHLPAWVTLAEEEWVKDVAEKLYNHIMQHQILYINKEVLFPRDNFGGTMTFENFKKQPFGGEADRFKDYVITMLDITRDREGIAPKALYISFFSNSSDHFVNALIEPPKGLVAFGGNLNLNPSKFELAHRDTTFL